MSTRSRVVEIRRENRGQENTNRRPGGKEKNILLLLFS
jgi:hypothetical protein